MADSTIANLTDGVTADATDRIPVERSPFGAGTNRYVTPAYLREYVNGTLAANAVVLGGGAGTAPFTDAGLTYNPSTDVLTTNGAINILGQLSATAGYSFSNDPDTSWGWRSANILSAYVSSQEKLRISTSAVSLTGDDFVVGSATFGILFNSADSTGGTTDSSFGRAGTANSVIFSASSSVPAGGGKATSRTEINKAVTAFTDGVAKATFTVTIPNAAHNATLEVEVTGICGAGGAIGAGEASATNTYKWNISRTAGVNAVVSAASAAFGAAASNVAGATTVTATAAASAIAGAVGATNTFTIDVTITKAGGASDNHTALMYGKLMNAAASGITIA